MLTRRAWIGQGTLALLNSAALADAPKLKAPDIGAPAPPFRVANSDGRTVSLADFQGRTVVLEWTNPECPYVAKHYISGNLPALQADAAARGVAWLTVSSAAPGSVGYLDGLEAADLTERRRAQPAHFLLDRDGQMREAYGVPVALTFAVIAPDGMLAYHGAIDDRPTARPEDVPGARNFVRAALDSIARGEMPKPAQTRPYGCVVR